MELTEEEQAALVWIKHNLDTQGEWTLPDYAEFYDADVRRLLAVVERLTGTLPPYDPESAFSSSG